MISKHIAATALLLSSALSLGILSHRAFASDFPFMREHTRPVQGVVVQVSSHNLQIQTGSDTIGVLLSRRTEVYRVATGSLADLKLREVVTVKVTPGTTNVQQIVISPQMANSHSRHGEHGDSHHHGQKPPIMPPSDPGVYRNVHIVALSNNRLQVRDDHGNSVSFPIDDAIKVTKILHGSQKDLAVGESVLAFENSGGLAVSVKIPSG